MSSLCSVCPAASAFNGATPDAGGVRCGVLAVDDEVRDHILTNDALDPVYRLRTDPSVVLNFCCGTALPVVAPRASAVDRLVHGEMEDADDPDARKAHFTNCDVWQLHCERKWLAEQGLGLDGQLVGHKRAAAFDAATASSLKVRAHNVEVPEAGGLFEADPALAVGPAPITHTEMEAWS